jgi:hypothetical protein
MRQSAKKERKERQKATAAAHVIISSSQTERQAISFQFNKYKSERKKKN